MITRDGGEGLLVLLPVQHLEECPGDAVEALAAVADVSVEAVRCILLASRKPKMEIPIK